MKILIVEDDPLTAEALTVTLSKQTYTVEVASDGQSGWELMETFTYDLVLLDVTLPKLDGLRLCQQIRSHGYQTPILLLTAHGSGHDKAIGLDAGADDYVVKPFDPEELVARIRALLRRGGGTSQTDLEWGALRLDPKSHEVTYNTRLLPLTPKEYGLLELFLRNHRRVFSCGAILENLWSFEDIPGEEAVRTHIKGLRQKLKTAGAPSDLIETVYGIGYRLKPLEKTNPQKQPKTEVKPPLTAPAASADPTPESNSQQIKQQTLRAIADVWTRFQPKILEQVTLLQHAARAIQENTLSQDLQQQAQQQAHTLAGSLGTFGLERGSHIAREIEQWLQQNGALSRAGSNRLQQLVERLQHEIMQSSPAREEPEHPTQFPDLQAEHPLMLIVTHDRPFAKQMEIEASAWGFETETPADLNTAQYSISQKVPSLVLLDLTVSGSLNEPANEQTNEPIGDRLSFLAELNQSSSVAVIVLLDNIDNNDPPDPHHPAAEQLAEFTVLFKPLAAAQVFKEATRILYGFGSVAANILIVDDDTHLLTALRAILQPWGLHVTTLDDPQRFWETLELVAPDLLILDIRMPQVSGVELCQQIRNHPYWCGLPIVILTAYTDAQTVNQVFASGADDFVSKPIVGPELVTRIISRLERIRLLRNLAEIDPLTKLPNRQKSTQDLTKLLRLAQRHHQSFCFVVLDINQFKRINQRYGHAVGDQILHHLGQWLQRSFREEDVVARWGGDEFVIGLYGLTKPDALHRLSHLLKTLHQEPLIPNQPINIQVMFCTGVAQYPDDGGDLQSLYEAAKASLTH